MRKIQVPPVPDRESTAVFQTGAGSGVGDGDVSLTRSFDTQVSHANPSGFRRRLRHADGRTAVKTARQDVATV